MIERMKHGTQNAMDAIKNHRIGATALVGVVAVAGMVGFTDIDNRLAGNLGGDSNGELTPSDKTAGMSPNQELSTLIVDKLNVAPEQTCQNMDGLDVTTAKFMVNDAEVTVVQPDLQRDNLQFGDAIANAFENNQPDAAKDELYTSFCENAYLTTAPATMLSGIELPNGKTIGEEIDWLAPYNKVSKIDDIAENRSALTSEQIAKDPAGTLEGLQKNEELAANVIALLEEFKYEGISIKRTIQNLHVPVPNGEQGLPEVDNNEKQMRAKGLVFTLTYKDSKAVHGDNSGTKVLCVAFNLADKRPEVVACNPGQKRKISLPHGDLVFNPKNPPKKTPKKNPPKMTPKVDNNTEPGGNNGQNGGEATDPEKKKPEAGSSPDDKKQPQKKKPDPIKQPEDTRDDATGTKPDAEEGKVDPVTEDPINDNGSADQPKTEDPGEF